MNKTLHIIMAQINPIVGDISGNTKLILRAISLAKKQDADLIVFPELALTGYPPEDLLLRPDLYHQLHDALAEIKKVTTNIDVILGYPHQDENGIYNAAAYFHKQKCPHVYFKQHLPNYGVFDEKRYFIQGTEPCIICIKGTRIGLIICEDAWKPGPTAQAKEAGAELMISINASPFNFKKPEQRENVIAKRVLENHIPFIYVASFGGQDELVFDGGSFAMNADGQVCAHAGYYETAFLPVICQHHCLKSTKMAPPLSTIEHIYAAIKLGIHDYVKKNRFRGVVLGVSGGIDSALVLCLAVDALGAENVEAVLLPSRYTTDISNDDAKALLNNLNVSYSTISIEPVFYALLNVLQPEFQDYREDVTEQNIQARIRAVILMAISNKKGYLLLTTSNKSETAVGYTTIYGDMAGGFAPIKDVPKTMVYQLAHYRNGIKAVIPERILTRAPTAELAPNQLDQDTLPEYDVLDKILEKYVEEDKSLADIVAEGFPESVVKKILALVNKNEYKRRQAPPGVRITKRAFGRERRYPITSGFKNI